MMLQAALAYAFPATVDRYCNPATINSSWVGMNFGAL